MHTEPVDIYSDASNAAVMRHPRRQFPGVLVQGDTLHRLCQVADAACRAAEPLLAEDDYLELDDLRNDLRDLLAHYKQVLGAHGMDLPFHEAAGG